MRSRTQHLNDDQIEAEVLATRDDPSAWELLTPVPPATSPRPAWMLRRKHLDLAAKFHVLSVLHRFGLEANLSWAQPDNVDITVLGRNGQTVTIDVKTVDGAREWLVDQFSQRKRHYVVIVAFSPEGANEILAPSAYIVASDELRKFLSRRHLTAISLETLSQEFSALDAWQLIISEQAA
jgi:hypothetical protein